ncbi:Mitochondrion protein, putative [Cryptococcus gattii WM276]|uniref:MICOS complex subunit MIC60 n=1 Tax=Cryptococcus gattii serotype B (strain WM276 / ATCC MYA-4071) TaxID=367775 RepID=E6R5L3_CRYGW|nr:Mitochondrion protein, putative [Cryptococcus gattii WM276]ADV21545.1 Mitochondrion protein, putative [Cryptococcus gattii WM276]
MYAQLRIARRAPPAPRPQRRLLATPPPPPPAPGAVHPRPVVVHTKPPPVPGSSTVATPPPPRPRTFRRLALYTALGVAGFYALSGYAGTKSDTYRDIFTQYVPGGEAVADYADDNGWDNLTGKAVRGWQSVTGARPQTTTEKVAAKIGEVRDRADEAKDKAVGKHTASQKIHERAEELKKAVEQRTHDAEARLKELTGEAKHKVQEATKDAPFNFSEGVEGIVRAAETALHKAEHKTEHKAEQPKAELRAGEVVEKGKPAAAAAEEHRPSSPFPDTQRPRELKPETVTPQVPSYEGKQLYTGPPLPLGHEPPPGYYLAPPPSAKKQAVEEKVQEVKEKLPLLVPKVKEFASEEPIISQLASTIDSLTSSLSTPSQALSPDATGILNKAQDDLTALNARLQQVKKAEKAKLEQSITEKKKEFEALLKDKEAERAKSEAGLKQTWQHERQAMVEDWRKELEGELEQQRQSIEQRLREEVVSQGIELQRRWLRSIKSQVETERGGRLAKLDSLTTSLKQLERITLDNSATLDDNVRLHKIWSALRAVQSKVDAGDLAFDDELRALKGLSAPTAAASTGEPVVRSVLDQIEKSGIPQTGVKSFAALSSWFTNTVAPRIQSSSLVPAPEEATVISHLASAGLSKIMFRPQAGRVPGDTVGAVLARAEWCLAEKDLDGAAREINSLTGWPAKLASDWLQQARRKLEVQQALEVVATEATLSSLLLV